MPTNLPEALATSLDIRKRGIALFRPVNTFVHAILGKQKTYVTALKATLLARFGANSSRAHKGALKLHRAFLPC